MGDRNQNHQPARKSCEVLFEVGQVSTTREEVATTSATTSEAQETRVSTNLSRKEEVVATTSETLKTQVTRREEEAETTNETTSEALKTHVAGREEAATTNETPEGQKSQGARKEEVATPNATIENEVTTTTTEAQNIQVAEDAGRTNATADENIDFEEHLRSINTETESAKKRQTKCTKKRKAERKETIFLDISPKEDTKDGQTEPKTRESESKNLAPEKETSLAKDDKEETPEDKNSEGSIDSPENEETTGSEKLFSKEVDIAGQKLLPEKRLIKDAHN